MTETITWTKTSEELPDEGETVLAISPYSNEIILAWIEEDCWFSCWDPDSDMSDPEYWAKLPPGPQV